MIASFLLSFLAGLLVLPVERLLKARIHDPARALGQDDLVPNVADVPFDAADMRILTFGLLMLVAAIVTWMTGADSSAYLAIAGGILGYFTTDLVAVLRNPNRSLREQVDKWGNVVPAGAEPEAGEPGIVAEQPSREEEMAR